MTSSLTLKSATVTSFNIMAAGSDPEPMESSGANGGMANFHQTARMPNNLFTNIRHIPYLDHNYGQPPPMTPPDSNSPAPEDIDTGNEDDEDDGVTRCICGYDHDDGYMICCDRCSVWQHIECMGISSNAVPENYLCEQCQPRELDKDRAKIIQARKREEMSDDDDDEDDCETEDEKDVQTYTAVSNTPTRITLTAKTTQQKRKRTRSKNKLEDREKKVRRKKHLRQKTSTEAFVPAVDEETNEPWEVPSNYGNIDRYEEIKENVYGKELEEVVLNWKENDVGSSTVDVNEQLCKVVEVQQNRKGIVTTEDMNKNQLIIEFKGKLMLQCKFESENPFFRRCSPYVLYYSKLDHMELCVDARKLGNDARFVRRSCSPSAQVKHFINKGKVHLGIYSLCPLPKGSEITIAFEFSFDEYDCYLDCACAQDTCVVDKYNTKYPSTQSETHTNRRLRTRGNDDSNSSHQAKMSPLRSLGSHSNQGDSDSDAENNPERSLSQSVSRHKKTREERKLEAYLKQIEKMEKNEKRNKNKENKEHKQVHRTSSDDTPGDVKQLINKHSNTRRLGSKRQLTSSTPGSQKSKRARLSSGSSEPLSPEEHSSAASTPTTPKVASSIPEEEGGSTPCASPSRSFKFPKSNSKVSCDEESKDAPVKRVKLESGEQSGVSSPSSPSTPREGDAEGLPVLSTASSTTDLTVDDTVDETSNVTTPKPIDSNSTGLDSNTVTALGITSLKERLVEISNSISSERDSPSPCSSTSGSPTCAESVMNSCNGPVPTKDADPGLEVTGPGSEECPRQHPVPAPGSPVASVIYGTKLTRSNPLYGSLKKRWLLQFLYGHNILNDRVPNGFKNNVNGTSMRATFRRKTRARIPTADPMPLKKRHLKKFQDSIEEASNPPLQRREVQDITTPMKRPTNSGLLMYSPITPENKLSHGNSYLLGQSSNEGMDHILTNEHSISSREPKPLRLNFDQPSMLKYSNIQSFSGQSESSLQSSEIGTALRIDTSPSTIASDHTPQRRPSDPRLLVASPEGTPLTSPSSSREMGPITPGSLAGSFHRSVIAMAHSSTDSHSGTPGKKKVSLLEYRNRSRQRLSSDGPKSLASTSHSPVSPLPGSVISSTSLSQHSSVPVKSSLSASMPNLSAASKYPGQKVARSASDSNGPCFEPVSPDEDMKTGVGGKLLKQTSVSSVGVSPAKRDAPFLHVEGNAELRRELQRRHEMISKKEEGISLLNERLGAIIHEALKKDKLKETHSPASSSSSIDSPAPPPPPPPPDLPATGDAMEIEDDDINVGSGKIYVNTPVVSSATLHHRAQPLAQPPAHPQPQPQRQLQPLAPVQVHNQLLPQSQLSPRPRVSLLGAFPAAQPQQRPVIASQATADYRIAPNLLVTQVHQVPRPLYPQLAEHSQHAPQSQQPYLITSPPGTNPSLVRFPTRVYQSSSGQATGFFPQ